MAFAISIGDCVALAGIVYQAVQNLSTAHGASFKFRQLLSDLEALVLRLRGLEALLQNGTLIENLDTSVLESTRNTVISCTTWLTEMNKTIKIYNLLQDESSSYWRRIYLKLRWTVAMEKNMPAIRARMQLYIGLLNLDVSCQMLSMHASYQQRLENRERTILDHMERYYRRISDIHEDRKSRTSAQRDMSVAVRGVDPPVDFDHTWFRTPLRFEDALGDFVLFPIEFGFEELKIFILSRFSMKCEGIRRAGTKKVAMGEYELFVAAKPRMLLTADAYASLSPGQWITMAIIIGQYLSPFPADLICPRPGCGSKAIATHQYGGHYCFTCGSSFDRSLTVLSQPYSGSIFQGDNNHTTVSNDSRVTPMIEDIVATRSSKVEDNSNSLSDEGGMHLIKNFRIIKQVLTTTPEMKNVRLSESPQALRRSDSQSIRTNNPRLVSASFDYALLRSQRLTGTMGGIERPPGNQAQNYQQNSRRPSRKYSSVIF